MARNAGPQLGLPLAVWAGACREGGKLLALSSKCVSCKAPWSGWGEVRVHPWHRCSSPTPFPAPPFPLPPSAKAHSLSGSWLTSLEKKRMIQGTPSFTSHTPPSALLRCGNFIKSLSIASFYIFCGLTLRGSFCLWFWLFPLL